MVHRVLGFPGLAYLIPLNLVNLVNPVNLVHPVNHMNLFQTSSFGSATTYGREARFTTIVRPNATSALAAARPT